jgi:hypothetical protein
MVLVAIRGGSMLVFLEETLFLWWIVTVIGLLRWFHNAAELDSYIQSAESWNASQTVALNAVAPEKPAHSRAS